MQNGDQVTLWGVILAIVAWLSGETGKAMLAGAAGGIVRWFAQETRRLIEGVIAVISGAFSAVYLSPLILPLLDMAGIEVGATDQAAGVAHFLSGLVGMSMAKIVVALIEGKLAELLARQGGRNE